MDRRLPTMIALTLLSRELAATSPSDDATDRRRRRRRRGATGADDMLRLAATALSVGYSVAATMRPAKPSKVEDPDAIPEMDGSCCNSGADSCTSGTDSHPSRTEGLHERNEAGADEDECSVSFDDLSFYVGPGEGFVSSASVCDSDISVTDDEDEEEDYPFDEGKGDECPFDELSDDEDSIFDDLPYDEIDISCQEKTGTPMNPYPSLRKPLQEQSEYDAVPTMKPVDSFGSMASEYTADGPVLGFEVTPMEKKATKVQSRANAVWSLYGLNIQRAEC